MASIFQPVVDTTRVFLNSAMGNLPEMIGENAERNRIANEQARKRLGFAGDVANAAGYFVPGLGAAKALKGLTNLPSLGRALVGGAKSAGGGVKAATRAVPAAERAVARKVVPGYAARETALARLGLPAMSTVSGRAGSTVAAHPVKSAVAAGALGVGTVASRNTRLYDEQNPPRMQAALSEPQAETAPGQYPARSIAFEPRGGSEAAELPATPTFRDIVDQVAAAQGGQISLAQMGAIAEVTQRTASRAGRALQPGDAAGAELEAIYNAQFQKALAAAGDNPEAQQKAIDAYEQKVLQLRKTRYNTLADEFGGLSEGQ